MKRQSPPFQLSVGLLLLLLSRFSRVWLCAMAHRWHRWHPIDGSPTGSPVPGILQARILEWVAILSYSVKAPQPGSLVCPVTKSTAIISIRDRGQGWQWKSINILIARSLSFCCALISQLPECSWSKAEESSSFCHALTSQLLEWLEQGSVLHGWGPLSLEPDLKEVSGVPNCFPGVLITGSSWLFDSGMVDPRNDTYNFNSSRGCQDNRVRACPNWRNCCLFFFFLIFNPYLISWLIGMNPIVQRNGCPF